MHHLGDSIAGFQKYCSTVSSFTPGGNNHQLHEKLRKLLESHQCPCKERLRLVLNPQLSAIVIPALSKRTKRACSAIPETNEWGTATPRHSAKSENNNQNIGTTRRRCRQQISGKSHLPEFVILTVAKRNGRICSALFASEKPKSMPLGQKNGMLPLVESTSQTVTAPSIAPATSAFSLPASPHFHESEWHPASSRETAGKAVQVEKRVWQSLGTCRSRPSARNDDTKAANPSLGYRVQIRFSHPGAGKPAKQDPHGASHRSYRSEGDRAQSGTDGRK